MSVELQLYKNEIVLVEFQPPWMAAATFYETAAMDEGDPPSWIAEASSIAAAAPQNKVPQNRYFYTDQKKCVSFDAKSGHKLVKIVELKKGYLIFIQIF